MNSQVAPVDLCEKLKALGAPQDTAYMWGRAAPGSAEAYLLIARPDAENACAAYTVAELGALMPADERWWSCVEYHRDGTSAWEAGYGTTQSEEYIYVDGCATEAEARAHALIEMAEHGVAMPWNPYGFTNGDYVTRMGDDVHLVRNMDPGDGVAEFVCVKAPALLWCKVGDVEFNLCRRYHRVEYAPPPFSPEALAEAEALVPGAPRLCAEHTHAVVAGQPLIVGCAACAEGTRAEVRVHSAGPAGTVVATIVFASAITMHDGDTFDMDYGRNLVIVHRASGATEEVPFRIERPEVREGTP